MGGWWYKTCYHVNLNGLPIEGKNSNHTGINWNGWLGDAMSLRKTVMMIKPAYP